MLGWLECCPKAKIHYTSFPVARPWQIGDSHNKSRTSPQHKRQVCNKSVTNWRRQSQVYYLGYSLTVVAVFIFVCLFFNDCCRILRWMKLIIKAVVSVVSCRFPNSITTTCWQQVGSNSPSTGKLRWNVCSGFWPLFVDSGDLSAILPLLHWCRHGLIRTSVWCGL